MNNSSAANGTRVGLEKMKKQRRSSSAADKVVASTAGEDSWKTFAGRTHGTEQFEVLDLFRGLKRSFHHNFLAGPPSSGTVCPVCYCEPDRPEDWHVTWCRHAVCRNCLQQYASIQVNDKEHVGPLKCPVCPQVLRRKDAIVAMGGNSDLISQWDTKIRNQLLRALPNYRPCPKCTSSGGGQDSAIAAEENHIGMGGGGGFVTAECLQPHYEERREAATRVLEARHFLTVGLILGYFTSISIMNKSPSTSASVDLFFMFVLIYPFVKGGMAAHRWLAQVARQTFFKPVTVECPCCNSPFILPAESEILRDDETSRWMDANTRQCPSCSAKIVKTGGCNHMHCSNCRADFCWACMRLRTGCKAFHCANGARYGNAVPGDRGQDGPGAPQPGDSILTIIDYLLERRTPQIGFADVFIVVTCLFARHVGVVQVLVGWIMAILSSVLASQILMGSMIMFLIGTAFQDLRIQHLQRQQQNRMQQIRRGNNRANNPFGL
ncbi:IBR/half ring-finger domain containing protein [Nitzschia inconspicua]|uniref:IBR/half ring-finger domain containing protein n=1 Tax=Nitzschia inconspicua TaxID=303405 RepID=A0A9K3PTV8_9STRA|nr:IBR/half ring-finger domain containing protein [Nitzschia inconspicua]